MSIKQVCFYLHGLSAVSLLLQQEYRTFTINSFIPAIFIKFILLDFLFKIKNKIIKDKFSLHAREYSVFRPKYPRDLLDFICSLVETKITAWDCGTGNGQLAEELAKTFKKVEATDISSRQIEQAPYLPNVVYKVSAAEDRIFPSRHFDLITVGQAVHWFDFEKFYAEVNRCLKNNGVIAIIGYGLIAIEPAIDKLIKHFYKDVVGKYWDKERKYIDEHYQTIPFPFQEIKAPEFSIENEWTFQQITGYLHTWSAVQNHKRKLKEDAVKIIADELQSLWGAGSRQIRFPILLRIGKKMKE